MDKNELKNKLGKTALLLCGGGARGILQSSMAQAVWDLGIRYDCLFSSSAGTLNGLLVHACDYDLIRETWLTIKSKDVYKKPFFEHINALMGKPYLYDSSPLFKLLKQKVNFKKLRANPAKFFINVTDLTHKLPVTVEISNLADEEILIYAFASASPPIFFPPVKIGNVLYTDSGITNNYGIISALKEGCETLIVLAPSISVEDSEINNIMDMVEATISISTSNYLGREIASVERINEVISRANVEIEGNDKDLRKVNLILITPEIDHGIGLLDFDYKNQDRVKLLQYGQDIATEALNEFIEILESRV